MNSKTLYKLDPKELVREWTISKTKNGLITMSGVEKMLVLTKQIKVEAKSTRSMDEQIELEYQSRIKKKIDQGYIVDKSQVHRRVGLNSLGFPKPMLALDIAAFVTPKHYIQYKYNGHRCLITRQGDEVIAYSRGGQIIESIEHITHGLRDRLEDGEVLDGELYRHGWPLQTISSFVRRKQAETAQIIYVLYDVVQDTPYADRLARMKEIQSASIYRAPACTDIVDTKAAVEEAVLYGYEGIIARDPDMGYGIGKRSKGLIKIKPQYDIEAVVREVYLSERGVTMLHCVWKGIEFRCRAPGTERYQELVFKHRNKIVGKEIRIKYSELTKEGIPFHPVAITFMQNIII